MKEPDKLRADIATDRFSVETDSGIMGSLIHFELSKSGRIETKKLTARGSSMKCFSGAVPSDYRLHLQMIRPRVRAAAIDSKYIIIT